MKRDEGLQAWRGRPWRKVSYLSLDARYEKARVERQRKTKAYMPKNSNFPVSSRNRGRTSPWAGFRMLKSALFTE